MSYYEYSGAYVPRSMRFLDVVVHAHVGFSMGLQGLRLGFVGGMNSLSGLFVRLTTVEWLGVGHLVLSSACRDVAFILYGMVGYGNE